MNYLTFMSKKGSKFNKGLLYQSSLMVEIVLMIEKEISCWMSLLE